MEQSAAFSPLTHAVDVEGQQSEGGPRGGTHGEEPRKVGAGPSVEDKRGRGLGDQPGRWTASIGEVRWRIVTGPTKRAERRRGPVEEVGGDEPGEIGLSEGRRARSVHGRILGRVWRGVRGRL